MGYQTKSNFASSNLLSLVASDGMTITVKAGEGDKFPSTGPFTCILFSVSVTSPDKDPTAEIVLIGSRTGDVLTVSSRAQEGTAAKEWVANSRIIHGLTAGALAELEIATGSTAPANPRIGQIWLDESANELYPTFSPSNLVERQTLTANASSVTFTGLNSLVDGDYLLKASIYGVSGAAATDLRIFANGDTTVTNYRENWTSNQVNDCYIATVQGDYPTYIEATISVIGGKFLVLGKTGRQNDTTTATNNQFTVLKPTGITTLNSILLQIIGGYSYIKAGSVFSLYKQNTPQNLIDATIKNLDLVTSDYLLKVGETAKRTYTGATSVPLYVKCEEGEYEVTIKSNTTTITVSTNAALNPNNTTYAGLFSRRGSVDYVNTVEPLNEVSQNNLLLCGGLCRRVELKVSTTTASKNVLVHSVGRDTGNTFHLTAGLIWNDTTTVWSSLGTITFPFAQSGTIIIKRIA